MAYRNHVDSLLIRNSEINKRICSELKSPIPNNYRIRELKKERLRLQDIIFKLSA
ncbi:MAG: DUF465 domain-containing protein [Caedimonadaceae bacterium]|nr:MAG: DUF465 domain-containing protein [Caedimonadaceae bacterium]